MDIKIPTGLRHHEEIFVTEAHSAKAYGSGTANVFATPAMIALMEKTALLSVQPYIPEGFTTVGIEVHIKHLKATPISKLVKSDSYLKSVEGKKLLFELHAWDDKGMIGIGTHTRYIVNENKFMDNLK